MMFRFKFKRYLKHNDIAKEIAKKHGIKTAVARKIIDNFLSEVIIHARYQHTVKIRGFGEIGLTRKGKLIKRRSEKVKKSLK